MAELEQHLQRCAPCVAYLRTYKKTRELVNQVLDMAKIEAGHGEWRSSAVDMGALIERAVLTTAELFHARGAIVTTALPAAVPPLQADEDRLLQVLLNLLSNAAKFLPDQQGRVQVALEADAAGLTVTVQDNGPGVPAAQQALIFEKFRQGGDDQHRPQGTGLGLPISRRIVEHFGGRMWVQSDPGQGALFGFTLPWQADAGATPAMAAETALPENTPPGDTR